MGILEATSSIVHSTHFDDAVVKLQSGLESELTERERQSVEMSFVQSKIQIQLHLRQFLRMIW